MSSSVRSASSSTLLVSLFHDDATFCLLLLILLFTPFLFLSFPSSLGLALSLFLKKSVKGKEAGVTLGLLGLFF